MLKQHKKTIILTSLLTLLPIPMGLLLWNRFPETMAIHWGITGEADGYARPGFAVFGLPLMMLATRGGVSKNTGLLSTSSSLNFLHYY